MIDGFCARRAALALATTLLACAGFGQDAVAGASTVIAMASPQANIGGYCFSAAGGSTAPGATVYPWTCGGDPSQQWETQMIGVSSRQGDNAAAIARLVNVKSGLCLDLQSVSTAAGIGLQQATCNGSITQQWVLLNNGAPYDRRAIKSNYSNLCVISRYVDAAPGHNGSGLKQYACDFTEVPNPHRAWRMTL
ncbi:RICIN domain-containing protein [Lysobacter enzymogenes]|uniref:RICIN domain-containing protein n=1 Tax=Lysobacter enzymogenes TaxID=69 RepID=UPI001AF3F65C|nr:RICIN domain-containing protein [Lysobacter enzymogenes]QQQ00716.1 RICIN domain-containing protein [Lysobacter enzymogenes]